MLVTTGGKVNRCISVPLHFWLKLFRRLKRSLFGKSHRQAQFLFQCSAWCASLFCKTRLHG